MRIKKLIAALSAITLLGSLATAVPMSASAKTFITGYEKITITQDMIINKSTPGFESGAVIKGAKNASEVIKAFDGDETTNFHESAQQRYLIDLGAKKTISKIVVKGSDKNSQGSYNQTLMVSATTATDINTVANCTKYDYDAGSNPNGFQYILRTNGTANYTPTFGTIVSKSRTNVEDKAYQYETIYTYNNMSFQIFGFGDWSYAYDIYEMELYTPVETEYNSGAVITMNDTVTYYSTLDGAITVANSATADCTIDLLEDANQSVQLFPNVAVTLNGNGHTITGSGTLYQAKADASKAITVKDAVLNISETSTSAPAFATQWKDHAAIVLDGTSVTADVVLYSTNNSSFTVKGDSLINGEVYLYVGSHGTETNKYRTMMNIKEYTGSGTISTRLIYYQEDGTDKNHYNYDTDDLVMNTSTTNYNKILFTDDTYGLYIYSQGSYYDIRIAEKKAITCVSSNIETNSFSSTSGAAAPGATVTITPKSDYKLASVPVVTKTGDTSTTVSVTTVTSGSEYTFTMPSYPVTVDAVTYTIPEEVTYNPSGVNQYGHIYNENTRTVGGDNPRDWARGFTFEVDTSEFFVNTVSAQIAGRTADSEGGVTNNRGDTSTLELTTTFQGTIIFGLQIWTADVSKVPEIKAFDPSNVVVTVP